MPPVPFALAIFRVAFLGASGLLALSSIRLTSVRSPAVKSKVLAAGSDPSRADSGESCPVPPQGTVIKESVERATTVQMIRSSTSAAVRFAANGFKVLDDEAVAERLAICASCEHLSGNRCEVCGCFLSLKAPLEFEECPLDKWP